MSLGSVQSRKDNECDEVDAPTWSRLHLPEVEEGEESPARALCAVPDPTENDVAYARHYHLDLEPMTPAELNREQTRTLIRLAYERNPHPWLVERLERIQQEVRRGR